jgi:hypothetical protein
VINIQSYVYITIGVICLLALRERVARKAEVATAQ